MNQLVQQNAATAEEASSSAGELRVQADELNILLGMLATLVGGNAPGISQIDPLKRLEEDCTDKTG
jgi:hypothetical protein